MTEIEVATVEVRSHDAPSDDEMTAWVCVAHCEIGGEKWSVVGASDTRDSAQDDLVSLLRGHGIEAPIRLNECLDPSGRRRLIWSARSRAMQNGAPIAVVGA